MKISLKNLLYLPIIFFFLPAFAFYMPNIGKIFQFYYISLYIVLLILMFDNLKLALKKMILMYKKTPFKYFIWTIVLIIINSIFLSFAGVTTISQTFSKVLMRFVLTYFALFLYFFIVIEKYINMKTFFKFFIFMYWLILNLGIVAYIGQFLNIEIVNNIFDFFANERILKYSVLQYSPVGDASNYSNYGLPRLDNLYVEPSFYARFLSIFMPLTYVIGLTKQKLFENIFINKYIKKTIIPLTWLNLIMTQSPIYLIFCIIITFLYFYKNIIQFINKNFILFITTITIVMSSFILLIQKIIRQESYITRIVDFIINVRNIDTLAIIDASLYTRIVAFVNTMCVFLVHPFTGVGLGNLEQVMLDQFLKSPIPITGELYRNANYAIMTKASIMYIDGYIYCLLASHGIFIASLALYFHYKLIKDLNDIYKKSTDAFYIDVSKALKWILVALFINFFYQFQLPQRELWFVYAFTIVFIYGAKKMLATKLKENL